MKLPLTERFLWQLYDIVEAADRAHEPFALRSVRDVLQPELRAMRKHYEREKARQGFSQFLYSLKRRGYVTESHTKGILFTDKGKYKALKAKFQGQDYRPRKDKKMIMVMFDIPENRRKLRDLLRSFLLYLKYEKLQQSIWVCRHDVLRETEKLVHEYNLDRYVHILLIEEILRK